MRTSISKTTLAYEDDMKRFYLALLFSLALINFSARADEMPRPDDRVIFDISGEDWVTTKTAHVTINVEAAVSASGAGNMRGDMIKAVNDVAKGDWRLTSFNRNQDQTGLERWSAMFEARLPENELNGLADTAKKFSKAGMQLSVGDINFTPTLEEIEAASSALRIQIYKSANDQLTSLNNAIPGRNYRIGMINFTTTSDEPAPMPRVVRGQANMMMMQAGVSAVSAPAPSPPLERAEKIMLTARVVYAAEGKADSKSDTKH